MLVSRGKMLSGLMFRLSSKEEGMTVSWAPVSQMAGLFVDLPKVLPAFLNLGRFSPSLA